MNEMAVAAKMTAEEYLKLPDRWLNLVDGEVVVTDPTTRHQDAVKELVLGLELWTRAAAGRGKASLSVDVELDAHNIYAPDVLWFASGRKLPSRDVRPYPLPDLAAEVRSPSTWRYDVGTKKTRYEQHGLRELWLVDTSADEVLVFRRSTPGAPEFDVALELARNETLTSPLLPGFALPLSELFASR